MKTISYKGAIYAVQKESPDAYKKRTGKCPRGMHFDGTKCQKSNGHKTEVPVKHIMGNGVFPSKKRVQEFADAYGHNFKPKDHAAAAEYHSEQAKVINRLPPSQAMNKSNLMEVHKSLHNYHAKKARESGIKIPQSPWSSFSRDVSQTEFHTKKRPGVP